jgi:predicted nucleotide-binding protein
MRMARPSDSNPFPAAELSREQMRTGIDRLKLRIADLEAFDANRISARNDPDVLALETSIEETVQRVFGPRTIEQRRYAPAALLHVRAVAISSTFGRANSGPPSRQIQGEFDNFRAKSMALLGQAIKGLEEELAESSDAFVPAALAVSKAAMRKIFVVHGHDGAPKAEVARYIQKLGFEPIILHEQPNKGRTLITKFREEADNVGFAVVLMTPDDLGKAAAGPNLNARARQNVVFELGFFIGKLGPERVAALVKGDIERPSDFDGVVYISLDGGDWQKQLGQELQAAGYDIDWNKVMR